LGESGLQKGAKLGRLRHAGVFVKKCSGGIEEGALRSRARGKKRKTQAKKRKRDFRGGREGGCCAELGVGLGGGTLADAKGLRCS